jgi:hypothetical protein
MSAVDDIRKLLQDLVTPDLKSLQARVEALDAKMDSGFKASDAKMDSGFRASDAKMDFGFKTLDAKLDFKIDATRDLLLAEMKVMQASMEANIAKLNHSLDLERRVAKIENDRAAERKDSPPEQRVA